MFSPSSLRHHYKVEIGVVKRRFCSRLASARSDLSEPRAKRKLWPGTDTQRRGPEVGFEEICPKFPTPLTLISSKPVSGAAKRHLHEPLFTQLW